MQRKPVNSISVSGRTNERLKIAARQRGVSVRKLLEAIILQALPDDGRPDDLDWIAARLPDGTQTR